MEATIKKLSWCARRNEPKGCVVPRNVFLQYAPTCRIDYGEKAKCADYADASTTDYSDGLEQLAWSTDGSDTETTMIKMISSMKLAGAPRIKPERRVASKALMGSSFKAAPGALAPPGLDTPGCAPEFMASSTTRGTDCQRQRLSSHAAAFVPSFAEVAPVMDDRQGKSHQLRCSIQMLKGVLEQWEAGFDGQQQQTDLAGLQEIISRLSPQEVGLVAGFLDSKEMQSMQASAPHGARQSMQAVQGMMQASSMTQAPMMGDFSYGQAPAGMGWTDAPAPEAWAPRPFAPFRGGSRFSTPIGAGPQPKRSKPETGSTEESLSTHLRDLAQLEPGRALMVRKINHLSDDRLSLLKAHFSQFGTVDRVMASPTRSGGKLGRLRPATLGFVIMGSTAEAQAVLAHGTDHVIQGVTVAAGIFESHPVGDKPEATNA